jgi:hypothetical protein
MRTNPFAWISNQHDGRKMSDVCSTGAATSKPRFIETELKSAVRRCALEQGVCAKTGKNHQIATSNYVSNEYLFVSHTPCHCLNNATLDPREIWEAPYPAAAARLVIDKVLSRRGYYALFALVGGLALSVHSMSCSSICAPTRRRTRPIELTLNSGDVCFFIYSICQGHISRRDPPVREWRVRELKTIRAFLTDQGPFSLLDISSPLCFPPQPFGLTPRSSLSSSTRE